MGPRSGAPCLCDRAAKLVGVLLLAGVASVHPALCVGSVVCSAARSAAQCSSKRRRARISGPARRWLGCSALPAYHPACAEGWGRTARGAAARARFITCRCSAPSLPTAAAAPNPLAMRSFVAAVGAGAGTLAVVGVATAAVSGVALTVAKRVIKHRKVRASERASGRSACLSVRVVVVGCVCLLPARTHLGCPLPPSTPPVPVQSLVAMPCTQCGGSGFVKCQICMGEGREERGGGDGTLLLLLRLCRRKPPILCASTPRAQGGPSSAPAPPSRSGACASRAAAHQAAAASQQAARR